MGTQYLIDTSAVIKYLNNTLATNGILFIEGFINSDCTISFISEIELQVWNPVNPADKTVYKKFVSQSNIMGINPDIISSTIEIRKNFRLKMADAIIAATAVVLNRTLVADNDVDFLKVSSLQYINPRKL